MEIPSQNAEEEGGELNVPEGEDLQSDAPKEGGEDLDIAGEDLQLDVPEEEKGGSNDFQLDVRYIQMKIIATSFFFFWYIQLKILSCNIKIFATFFWCIRLKILAFRYILWIVLFFEKPIKRPRDFMFYRYFFYFLSYSLLSGKQTAALPAASI